MFALNQGLATQERRIGGREGTCDRGRGIEGRKRNMKERRKIKGEQVNEQINFFVSGIKNEDNSPAVSNL